MNETGYDVVVAGGGPGGATCAAYLAREGYRVLVLEKDRFPRHRIGESLLPSLMPVIEDFGLLDELASYGFPRKTGGTFVWGKSAEPWDVLFDINPFLPFQYTYHVERARFDKMLLDHARKMGAEVREGVAVKRPLFDGERVAGVAWEDEEGRQGEVRARFVVDASGPASIVGRQVANRQYDPRMKQVAFYTYFEGCLGTGDRRDGHVIVISNPKGWFWFIPVHAPGLGGHSIGLVSGQEFKDEYNAKGIERFFEEALEATPYLQELMGPAAKRTQPMRAITDWAYACDRTAGPGFYLVGDSACFLDPMLSTGVSMAMLAGFSASACLRTTFEDPSLELEARRFYDANYLRMWTVTRDFLHYFYAGNQTAGKDDIFWQARSTLKLDENIGAQQAFCFMVNTIPGNPHPALEKRIHMFDQFMAHLEHPVEVMEHDERFRAKMREKEASWVELDELHDGIEPVVNGTLESSWVIDAKEHRLKPVRGVAYDAERPVMSSTASWLLGRNLFPLADADVELLSRFDGRTWGEIVAAAARETGAAEPQLRREMTERLAGLWKEKFVLLRGEAMRKVAHG